MASRTRQITEKIRDLIAVDFSAKESGIDMSNTVQIGATIEPPYVPFACVSFAQAASEYGQSLGRYRITNTFEIYAFLGGADVEERTVNAMDLVEDMVEAQDALKQSVLERIRKKDQARPSCDCWRDERAFWAEHGLRSSESAG